AARQAAAKLSGKAQRRSMGVLLIALGVAFLAALMSDASSLFDPTVQVVLAWFAAGLLVVAIGAQYAQQRLSFDQQWFQARAVAESLKTATWRYMMKVPPYDDADAERELARLTRAVLERSPLVHRLTQ